MLSATNPTSPTTAKDVDAALHAIVAEQGGMTPEAAVDWVKQFKKDGRYQRDVY